MRKLAIISFAITVAILGLTKAVPFLRAEVPSIESTPGPESLSPALELTVRGGQTLCVSNLSLGPESNFARFTLRPGESTRSRIVVSARDAAGRSSTVIPEGSSNPLIGRIRAPESDSLGRICLRNRGRQSIVLLSSPPGRGSTIAETTIDGVTQDSDVFLTILRAQSEARLDTLPTAFSRAASFSVFPGWIVWALAGVVLAIVPLSVSVALWKSLPD